MNIENFSNEEIAIKIKQGNNELTAVLWDRVNKLMFKILRFRLNIITLPTYLMQELDEEFFAFNPKNKEGEFRIPYEFPRMRALTNAMYSLYLNVEKSLKKNNIFVYDDKTA